MKYEKPTIYNTAEQHKRIFDELSVAKAVIENNNELIADLSKKVERLQEQLAEANELLKLYFPKKRINSVCVKPINDYKTKWGVK